MFERQTWSLHFDVGVGNSTATSATSWSYSCIFVFVRSFVCLFVFALNFSFDSFLAPSWIWSHQSASRWNVNWLLKVAISSASFYSFRLSKKVAGFFFTVGKRELKLLIPFFPYLSDDFPTFESVSKLSFSLRAASVYNVNLLLYVSVLRVGL